MEFRNISHLEQSANEETLLKEIEIRIGSSKQSGEASIETKLSIFESLKSFGFGRFLLLNRGINGYWTRYMIQAGDVIKSLDQSKIREQYSHLEHWLLTRCPSIVATQQRYKIFSGIIKDQLRDGMTSASIPCGFMDDLLTQDYTKFSNVRLFGFGIDPFALQGADENAKKRGIDPICKFVQSDAWRIEDVVKFDLIVSNGLNIYEQNDESVIQLYKMFFKLLKPNGKLLTSFLVPPPWNEIIAHEDLQMQKIVFGEVIQAKWQTYRSEACTQEQLRTAGFTDIHVIHEKSGIFPTVVATKSA